MSALARWLRELADTIDPQLPNREVPTGLMSDDRRERLCRWVRDNGLDPSEIPADADMVVSDGTITTDVFARGEDGKVIVDGFRIRRDRITVPLIKPWSESRSGPA